jgi:SHS2 domain-containing protein
MSETVYRWVDHTGEMQLEIEAGSERAVFAAGFEAMRELLAAPGPPAEPARVELAGSDRAVLLADWLAELVFLGESEGLSPTRLASLELSGDRLEAVVEGERGDPPHLVKAATYHRLSLERDGDRWRATVVLDV